MQVAPAGDPWRGPAEPDARSWRSHAWSGEPSDAAPPRAAREAILRYLAEARELSGAAGLTPREAELVRALGYVD